MTFTILSDTTSKLIHRSNVRPTDDPLESNLRIDPLTVPKIIKDKLDIKSDTTTDDLAPDPNSELHAEPVYSAMPIIDTSDLVGRTFLTPANEDGQRLRARIVKAVDDYEDDNLKDSSHRKFVCSVNDNTVE